MERDRAVAGLGHGPGAARLHEQRPVRAAVGEALAVLAGLVVDLADGLAEAERLRLVLDARLVHQRLSVDGVAAEADTLLQRARRGAVLDDDVSVVGGGCVDAAVRGGRARRGRTSARGDGADEQGQCRAGRYPVLAHSVSSRRSAFPAHAAESRPPGASVPLRADGWCRCGRSGLLARGSPPSIRLPEVLATSVARWGRRLLAHSCATAPVSHRIPLVPCPNLSWRSI